MKLKIMTKHTHGHKITIVFSSELSYKSPDKSACLEVYVDGKYNGIARYTNDHIDFDGVLDSPENCFEFKYEGKTVYLKADPWEMEDFECVRMACVWSEYESKNFVKTMFLSCEDNQIVHFAFSEQEAKKFGSSWKKLVIGFDKFDTTKNNLPMNEAELEQDILEWNEDSSFKDPKNPFLLDEFYKIFDVIAEEPM